MFEDGNIFSGPRRTFSETCRDEELCRHIETELMDPDHFRLHFLNLPIILYRALVSKPHNDRFCITLVTFKHVCHSEAVKEFVSVQLVSMFQVQLCQVTSEDSQYEYTKYCISRPIAWIKSKVILYED